MKRFIMTVISILILFNKVYFSTYACEQGASKIVAVDSFKEFLNGRESKVLESLDLCLQTTIFLFYNVKFNEDVDKCQLAANLLNELKEKGINANFVLFYGFILGYAFHMPALMIESYGTKYILDPKILRDYRDLNAENIAFFGMPLEKFWKYIIDNEINNLLVIKGYPKSTDLTFNDLIPGVNYEIIERLESE